MAAISHPAWTVVAVMAVYILLLPGLWWVLGKGSETLNFTTAYFLVANFVVVWWYAWLTRGLLQESRTAASAATDAHSRPDKGSQRAKAAVEQEETSRLHVQRMATFGSPTSVAARL
jgi:hypothetical protein